MKRFLIFFALILFMNSCSIDWNDSFTMTAIRGIGISIFVGLVFIIIGILIFNWLLKK
jgi:hypothetical protein